MYLHLEPINNGKINHEFLKSIQISDLSEIQVPTESSLGQQILNQTPN